MRFKIDQPNDQSNVQLGNSAASAAAQPESALDLLTQRLERLRASPDAERVELASTLRRSDDLLKQARAMLDGQ